MRCLFNTITDKKICILGFAFKKNTGRVANSLNSNCFFYFHNFFETQKLLLVRVLKPNNPFQAIHVSLLRSIFQDTCLMRGPNSLYMTPKLPRPRSLWSSFMLHPALNHGRGARSHATRIRIRLPQMVTFDCEVIN